MSVLGHQGFLFLWQYLKETIESESVWYVLLSLKSPQKFIQSCIIGIALLCPLMNTRTSDLCFIPYCELRLNWTTEGTKCEQFFCTLPSQSMISKYVKHLPTHTHYVKQIMYKDVFFWMI